MGRFEKDLTRVSVWWGPSNTALSHVPYRDKLDKIVLANDDAILLLNNFLFQQKEPPKQVHVTVEWE
jgi:hypothetical protein